MNAFFVKYMLEKEVFILWMYAIMGEQFGTNSNKTWKPSEIQYDGIYFLLGFLKYLESLTSFFRNLRTTVISCSNKILLWLLF